MKPLRILLADDDAATRQKLRRRLDGQPGMKVIAEAGDGQAALKMAFRLKPNLAILDLNLPALSGIEAAKRIRKSLPQTEVLVLAVPETARVLNEVLQSGAHGCVFKKSAEKELLKAVHAVAKEKTYFASCMAALISNPRSRLERNEPRLHRLSPREREVLKLLAEGKSNKEVASLLEISLRTAETHRANIMSKLELHSVVDLTHFAFRAGLVET